MISFSSFYRTSGLRLLEHLTNPQLQEIANFEWPLNSKYNFISDSGDVGPPIAAFPLSYAQKTMYMQHVYEMKNHYGKFRLDQDYLTFDSLIRAYHRGKPNCQLSKNITTINSETNLVVKSFAGIMLRYRYIDNPFSRYDKFRNRWTTILENLNEEMLETSRNQFIFMPAIVPTVSREKMDALLSTYDFFDKNPRVQDIKKLKSEDNWLFFQFWLWLGNERKQSMFKLIDPANYPKVNFVFTTDKFYTVLNLEYLNSFLMGDSDEDGEVIKDPIKFRKRFMAYASLISNVVEIDVANMTEEEAKVTIADASKGLNAVVVRNSKEAPGIKVIAQATDDDSVDEGAVQFKKDKKETQKVDRSLLEDDKELDKLLEDSEAVLDGMEPAADTDFDVADQVAEDPETLKALLEIDPEDQFIPIAMAPEDGIIFKAQELLKNKQITLSEFKRFERLSTKYLSIDAPEFVARSMGKEKVSVADVIVIKPEETTFAKRKAKNPGGVVDEAMLETSVEQFKHLYVKKLLHRNILAEIINLQKSGIVVHDIKTKEINNIVSRYTEYAIQVQPVGGSVSTINIKVPTVDEEGIILHGGVNYYLKTQRGDLPIRKIGPRRVALSSHNGKIFIDRLENVSTNYGVWLTNQIVKAGIDVQDNRVIKMQGGNVFDNKYKSPLAYSSIAQRIMAFELAVPSVSPIVFNFDHTVMEKQCNPTDLKRYKNDNVVPCGFQKSNKNIVVMDKEGFMAIDTAQGFKKIGRMEELLDLDYSKSPIEIATITLFGDKIPLGLIMAYHIGLKKLLKVLSSDVKVVPAKKIIRKAANEFVIRFADYALIVSRTDPLSSLVLGGINVYKKYLRELKLSQMENREYLVSILEKAGHRSVILNEADVIWDRFIDDITKEQLIRMNEPTTILELYRRSAELLLTDEHPDEIDGNLTRYLGYERLASAVSLELTKSCRDLKRGQLGSRRGRFSMKPDAVYMTIMTDSAKEQTNETNPIQDLKQNEAVTMAGRGGRSSETMVKRTRVYPKTDEGVISETGVDSGNVGVISYFAPNANITSLYGNVESIPAIQANSNQLLSTSALIAPFIEHDDAKRIVFSGVQQTHTIATKGARVSNIRTGQEAVLINRVRKKFGGVADMDGKVKSIENNVVQIEYKDKTIKAYPIGDQITKGPGTLYSTTIATELKVGQNVKEGDIITYNADFFEKDWYNPDGVVWRSGVKATIIFEDSLETYEDGSVISKRVADLCSAKVADVREVILDFDQIPAKMMKEGERVEYDSILCTIQEPVMAGSIKLDEETIKGLEKLAQDKPKAKFYGTIQAIEVYYQGELADMNPDLQKIVHKYENLTKARRASMGEPATTCQVDYTFKINGVPLNKKQVVFKFYISHEVGMDVGDKLVFGNQMKATVSRVLTGVNRTAAGEEVDGYFSYRGDMNRIVNSLKLWGTTSKVLDVGTQWFVDIALGKKEAPDF